MNKLQLLLEAPLVEDDTLFLDAHRFKALLETIIQILFDYLAEHPRLRQMLAWEMAEGWQTYIKISGQLQTDDVEPIDIVFQKAQKAGLLRSNFAPMLQLTLALQICQSYLTSLPLYQMVLPDKPDLASDTAMAEAKKYIVQFVVAGMMADPVERNE